MDIDFVKSLPFTPHAKRLLSLVEPFKPIILTSPSRTNATGSQHWIRKKLPKFFYEGRYLIGPCKSACANPFSILVDDYSKNTKEFKENGGHSILFPTWHNENSPYIDNPLNYFSKTFKSIMDLILDKPVKGMVYEGTRHYSSESEKTD
jgi:5'(3')-deoxyribonucleotidase